MLQTILAIVAIVVGILIFLNVIPVLADNLFQGGVLIVLGVICGGTSFSFRKP